MIFGLFFLSSRAVLKLFWDTIPAVRFIFLPYGIKRMPLPSGVRNRRTTTLIQNIMSLQTQIMEEIKTAMKAKDTVALESLRSIKSELLLAQTATGSKEEISEDEEVKLLQRLVKTRKESARIFTEQNRPDLAEPELAQIAVIEKFLPAQLSEAEIEIVIEKIITETGASGIASMGKVMGLASAQLGGTAEGKTISTIVKKLLT
jgi:uncharacterized protein YqeY